jgi:putative nucleotidyltransferase with HDIG domain
LFSGALMEVLRKGERSGVAAFSLDDVGRKVKDLLRNTCPEEWTRPEVHSPDMREGNVAYIPIFPNPGFELRLANVLTPGQIGYVHNLESLLLARDGQLRQLVSSLENHLEIALEAVAETVKLRGLELDAVGRRARDILRNKFPQGWPAKPHRPDAARESALVMTNPPLELEKSAISSQESLDRVHFLESLLATRTEQLEEMSSNLERSYDITLQALGDAIDLKDREAEGHSKRVTAFTMAICRAMGMPREQIDVVARGAFLHDIGKMAVPDQILLKPGRLNDEEIAVMRQHSYHGYQMLKRIPFLSDVCEIVYSHQERFDGSGYPRGLKGNDIPLGARVFAVADTLDAITTNRPYRAAQSLKVAQDKIRDGAGTLFDPNVVRVFLEMPGEIFEDLRREIDTNRFPLAYSGENERLTASQPLRELPEKTMSEEVDPRPTHERDTARDSGR